jgi:hypothetical protein
MFGRPPDQSHCGSLAGRMRIKKAAHIHRDIQQKKTMTLKRSAR